jgi:hypothetical protein
MMVYGAVYIDPYFLDLGEVSSQLHAPAALPLRKEPTVPIRQEVGWTL